MTTAASPPADEKAKERIRHFTADDVKKAYGFNCTGMGERSTEQYAALNFGVEGPEEQSEFREAIDRIFARRGESLDPLAWAMRRIANRETVIEKMMRMINKDEVPASHFGVLRHLFNDCDRAIKDLCIVREKLGRDEYQNKKDEAKIREEAARNADNHFALQKLYEGQGYGYVPAVDMLQPGIDLNREEAAARDIFRMRMMPKSPREDAILLEIAGLNKTIREEDKLRPDELSDKKIHPGFRWFNPKEYVDDEDIKYAGTGHYRDDAHFNRVIKAERIRNYNDVWTEANELIDGIMDAFDIRLGFVHESIGIPDKVQKALNGDEAAITLLKEEVAKIKAKRAERVVNGEKERPNPNLPTRLTSMIMNYVPMLFTAFVTGWMMVCMTLGQVGMNELQAAVAEQPQKVDITLRRDDSGDEIQKQQQQNVTQVEEPWQWTLPVAVITTECDDYYPEMGSPRSMTGGGSRDVDNHLTTTIIARWVASPHAPPPVTDRGLYSAFSSLFPSFG